MLSHLASVIGFADSRCIASGFFVSGALVTRIKAMEQFIRTAEYKEHELSVTCSHDQKGWMIDKLLVCRGNR